jgi:hypothetical protein
MPPQPIPVAVPEAPDGLSDIEWAIHEAFGPAGAAAVAVARCESSMDPTAANGPHAGLFQLSATWHQGRAARLGYAWSQMYQAVPNITVAYDLYSEQGWTPWTCAA